MFVIKTYYHDYLCYHYYHCYIIIIISTYHCRVRPQRRSSELRGLLHSPGPRQWGIVGGDDLARWEPDDAQGAAVDSSLGSQ